MAYAAVRLNRALPDLDDFNTGEDFDSGVGCASSSFSAFDSWQSSSLVLGLAY